MDWTRGRTLKLQDMRAKLCFESLSGDKVGVITGSDLKAVAHHSKVVSFTAGTGFN